MGTLRTTIATLAILVSIVTPAAKTTNNKPLMYTGLATLIAGSVLALRAGEDHVQLQVTPHGTRISTSVGW